MSSRRRICTAALVLSVLSDFYTAASAVDQSFKRRMKSFRELAYNLAVINSLDRDGDGVVVLNEAAFGIRSHAEASSQFGTPDINIRTMRDCSRVAAFSDEVPYVLDCAAEFARERLRCGDGSRPLLISEVIRHFSGEVENRDPHFGLCENLVDRNEIPNGILSNSSSFKHLPRKRLCRTLRNLGFCALTCLETDQVHHPFLQSFTSKSIASRVEDEIHILVSSDWHAEAWYDTSNNEGINSDGDTRGN